MALATVFVAFAQLIVDQGLGDALIQRKEVTRSHVDTAFWVALATGLLLTALGLILAGPIAGLLKEPDLAPILQVLSLTFVLSAMNSIQIALLRRELAFRSLAIRSIVAAAGGGVVGIVMAVNGFGAWALVGQLVATSSPVRPHAPAGEPVAAEAACLAAGVPGAVLVRHQHHGLGRPELHQPQRGQPVDRRGTRHPGPWLLRRRLPHPGGQPDGPHPGLAQGHLPGLLAAPGRSRADAAWLLSGHAGGRGHHPAGLHRALPGRQRADHRALRPALGRGGAGGGDPVPDRSGPERAGLQQRAAQRRRATGCRLPLPPDHHHHQRGRLRDCRAVRHPGRRRRLRRPRLPPDAAQPVLAIPLRARPDRGVPAPAARPRHRDGGDGRRPGGREVRSSATS